MNPSESPAPRRFHRVWFDAIATLLAEIDRSPAPADRTVNRFFRDRPKLGSRDHTLIAETVYDVLRNRRHVERAAHEALDDTGAEALAWAGLLRTGQWKPGELPGNVAALERLHIALQRPLPEPVEPAAVAFRWSIPEWLAEELVDALGPARADRVGASLRGRAPLTIRSNALRISRADLAARLEAAGIPSEPTRFGPDGLVLLKRLNFLADPAFREGLYEVQDEGSQLIARLVEARPGQKIIDACAGSGGKTLALAASMNNRGMLYAFDNSEKRIDPLKLRARRAGVHNVRRGVVDGYSDVRIERLRDEAHAVLIDAPCSGLGVIRRHPDAADRVDRTMLDRLMATQRGLLHAWSRAVRPGGRLVYATCSLLRDENERMVEEFVATHRHFELLNARELLAAQGIDLPTTDPWMRLYPDAHNTDGFFAAALVRKA